MTIATWAERCETHPDHQSGFVTEWMIHARMQEEIDALRVALAAPQEPVAYKIQHPKNPHCFYVSTEMPQQFRLDTGESDEYFGGEVTPLYAAAPAAPASAEPTDEQIIRAWNESEGTRHGYIPFARAVLALRDGGAA